MMRDLMSADDDLSQKLRMDHGPVSDDKKRRFGLVPVKQVEQQRRVHDVGTIINRQPDLLSGSFEVGEIPAESLGGRHKEMVKHPEIGPEEKERRSWPKAGVAHRQSGDSEGNRNELGEEKEN